MDLSICPQCNMLFVSREEFLAHTKAKCARKITCFTCGKLFTRVQGLATHLVEVRHGETICSICGHEGESQKDAEIHIRKHAIDHDRPYFCVNCTARFSTRKKWENHLPKHSSEAPFVCKECGKGTTTKSICLLGPVTPLPILLYIGLAQMISIYTIIPNENYSRIPLHGLTMVKLCRGILL